MSEKDQTRFKIRWENFPVEKYLFDLMFLTAIILRVSIVCMALPLQVDRLTESQHDQIEVEGISRHQAEVNELDHERTPVSQLSGYETQKGNRKNSEFNGL